MTTKPKKRLTTPQRKRLFLAAYAETGVITRAAKAAGIAAKTHYRWLEDESYLADFEEAKQAGIDSLEAEARRRAIEGQRRYKFDAKGKPIIDPRTGEQYFEDVRSDTLLIFLLKGALPQKYREHVSMDAQVRQTGSVVLFLPQSGRGDDDNLPVVDKRPDSMPSEAKGRLTLPGETQNAPDNNNASNGD